jgi:hypothetical protein
VGLNILGLNMRPKNGALLIWDFFDSSKIEYGVEGLL